MDNYNLVCQENIDFLNKITENEIFSQNNSQSFNSKCLVIHIWWFWGGRILRQTLTPLLPQPVKCPGCKMHARTYNQYIFQSYNNLLSMLCVLMKICSHAGVKKKTKRLMAFNFGTFLLVVFKWHHGSEAVKIQVLFNRQRDWIVNVCPSGTLTRQRRPLSWGLTLINLVSFITVEGLVS